MLDRTFHLTVPAARASLAVVRLTGTERIHAPFAFALECVAASEDLAAASDWVSEPAELRFGASDDAERTVTALIEAVEVGAGRLRIELVPRVAGLLDAVDHRVFVAADSVQIVATLLSEHGIALEDRVVRALPRRAQCIQAFESDLDHVSRLLSDEGIAWFLTPDGRTVVLADTPGAFEATGLKLPVLEDHALRAGPAVFRHGLTHRVVPDAVVLGDYDFTRPALDQTARTPAGDAGLRQHLFPGGHTDPSIGRERAELRLQAAQRRREELVFHATHRGLWPGLVVELEGAPEEGVDGRWLVVEVSHEAADARGAERPYVARVLAVPAADGYRPRPVPSPRLGGVESATIAGPAGVEIHPDPHARVRLVHRYDHRAPGDDRSSAWVRTVQPACAGAVLLPRVGWEALVAFGAGAGDDPWVLGRLDNGVARPAEALPAKKVWSAFGTPTSPGGGSLNRIALDDTAGAEGMHLTAAAELSESTANDKVTSIQVDDAYVIGADRNLDVAQVFETGVKGTRTLTVSGSRETSIAADESVTAASEMVAIGAVRFIRTGGDWAHKSSAFVRIVAGGHLELPIEHQTRLVLGGSLLINAGAWQTSAATGASVGVGGGSALLVSGPKAVGCVEYGIEARSALAETYGSRTVSAGGNIEGDYAATLGVDAGTATWSAPTIHFSAPTIHITASGCSVIMSGSSVTVGGPFASAVASTITGNLRVT